jgi:recombination protein RecT
MSETNVIQRPSHIKPEKFARVTMTVAGIKPELLAADRKTLLASCMKCAADGLVPDDREAALVIFNTKVKRDGKDTWVKAVQYMPMLAGIQKRVRNSGEIASVEAHVIYENDKFIWRQGTDGAVVHEPKFPGDRGGPIGAYAVAKFKDGSPPQFEVMDRDQIEKVRSVSRSKDGPTWTTWWGEMARKTVFRRLSKWLPNGAEVSDMMGREDEDAANGLTDRQRVTIDGVAGAMPSVHHIGHPASGRLDALELLSAPDEDGVIEDANTPSEGDTYIMLATATKTPTQLDAYIRSDSAKAIIRDLSEDDSQRVAAAVSAHRNSLVNAA